MSPPAPAGSTSQPIHALHVVDARDGVEPLLSVRAALEAPGRHDVILIGATRDEHRAALLGVVTTDRVSPSGASLRSWVSGGAAFLLRLRRLAADRLAAQAGHEPILLAHGPRAAISARSAVPKRIPMLALLPREPRTDRASPPVERLSLALEDDVAVTFDPDIAAACRAANIYDVRVLPVPRPALAAAPRDQLRARLGLDPDTLVLATLADPPSAGDARRLASFTGWLFTMDRRAVGLVPRDRRVSESFRRGVRFTRLHGRRWGLLEVDLPLPLLLPACDVAMIDTAAATTVGPVMIRAAQAAGVATVVPRAPWLRRLHADDEAQRTLFAPNTTTLTMIHRLSAISESPESLAATRAAAQRCAAASDPTAFARDLARLIAERLNLPLAAGDTQPRFVPAALAAGAT